MLLSSTNHLVLSRSCNFSFLIRLTGVSCLLFKFFPFCQVLPPFSTGVLSKIFLTHCAILSIVRRQCVVDLIKYPLILSSSCSFPSIFSRSVALITSFLFLLYFVLTGVASMSILSLKLVFFAVFLVPCSSE